MEEGEKYNHEVVVKEMYDYILGIPVGMRSESAMVSMLVWVVGYIAAGVAQMQEDTAEGEQGVMDVADIVSIGMMTAAEQSAGWGDILVDEMVA